MRYWQQTTSPWLLIAHGGKLTEVFVLLFVIDTVKWTPGYHWRPVVKCKAVNDTAESNNIIGSKTVESLLPLVLSAQCGVITRQNHNILKLMMTPRGNYCHRKVDFKKFENASVDLKWTFLKSRVSVNIIGTVTTSYCKGIKLPR